MDTQPTSSKQKGSSMPVISFASSKGGAGKTTSAIILATELAQGTDVILIDADPAGRLTRWAGLSRTPGRIEVIASKGEREIQDEIAAAKERASFVLIDLEGSASRLTSFSISESDLVIVPTGDEQQDADEAIETLAQIAMEGRARRRPIPAAVLFARTNAAVKSKLEKHINTELRSATRVFDTELHRRTAFSSLHNSGGGLRQLDPAEVNGIDKAIANAQAFAAEVVDMLEETRHAAVA
ncbi:ParA family protein [Roseivivax marinus]|uniref:ParA family protein n=1 Tax=Roseivivax marinus TaxID=1379903 RepID=UPI001FD100CA|nr:ParA family protein [Roseivivax marinus]